MFLDHKGSNDQYPGKGTQTPDQDTMLFVTSTCRVMSVSGPMTGTYTFLVAIIIEVVSMFFVIRNLLFLKHTKAPQKLFPLNCTHAT